MQSAMARFEKDRTKGHVWLYFFVPKTFDLQTATFKLGDSTVKLKKGTDEREKVAPQANTSSS